MFALSRISEGGCILADEVGLGKTIEAGLVIAQLLAEGARRVLLMAPKALVGQWQQELFTLFGLDAVMATADAGSLAGDGIFILGRESATGARGAQAIIDSALFDLCVVDEAHELFSGLHQRFDRNGHYREDHPKAGHAGRLKRILDHTQTPVLLLTATPIQNNLVELWSLVHYVDRTQTLLGGLPTFKQLFCGAGGRGIAEGQELELRSRIATVCQRTLRRQAQEFLRNPFVGRHARLFEYSMTPDERQLYDDVTLYLLDPNIIAFRGSGRHLLLLGFHRRMASSSRALASSLENVAERLRTIAARHSGGAVDDDADILRLASDLEDDDLNSSARGEVENTKLHPLEVIEAELARVMDFVRRARGLGHDSKAEALLQAVQLVLERGKAGEGAAKLVIFTESIVTQDYLFELLAGSDVVGADDITLFRGSNQGGRASRALARWRKEVEVGMSPHTRPGLEIATRQALVHEFKTQTKVFISTEAGAKGLNLQFCETVVNFDLPWNPQRIEQRIGRCHRYGQKRDVTVINFIARDNEAQRLTFDILTQKLELFGDVFDASNEVLHRADSGRPELLVSALGASFQKRLEGIYELSRTIEEVEEELVRLREEMESERKRFEEIHKRTAEVIESALDEQVRQSFRSHQEALPRALDQLDRDMELVTRGYLEAEGIDYELVETEPRRVLRVPASDRLPEALRQGLSVTVGASTSPETESLHPGHVLVRAAVEQTRRDAAGVQGMRFVLPPDAPLALARRRGRTGQYVLLRATYEGFEPTQELHGLIVFADGECIDGPMALQLLSYRCQDAPNLREHPTVDADEVDEGVDDWLFELPPHEDTPEQARYERAMLQLERFVDDKALLRKQERDAIERRIETAKHQRATVIGAAERTRADETLVKLERQAEIVRGKLEKLERREDPDYQRFREHVLKKRYIAPKIERLIDIPVELA